MKISRKIAKLENVPLHQAIYKYLQVTRSFHNLTTSTMKLVALMVYLYYLSPKKDPLDKWEQVFSYEGRIKIRQLLGDMTEGTFNNALTSLRQKGIIKQNTVSPLYMPIIDADTEEIEVVIKMKLKK